MSVYSLIIRYASRRKVSGRSGFLVLGNGNGPCRTERVRMANTDDAEVSFRKRSNRERTLVSICAHSEFVQFTASCFSESSNCVARLLARFRPEFDINFVPKHVCVHGCSGSPSVTGIWAHDSECLSDSCLRNCSVLHKITAKGASRPGLGGGISSPHIGHLKMGCWCSSKTKVRPVVVAIN